MKKGDVESPTTTMVAAADAAKDGDIDSAPAHKHTYKYVVSRYFVKKHGWMSKTYRRLFLTNNGEILLVSATSTDVTDRWRYENVVSVNPDPRNPEDFTIVLRKDDKSDKTEKITFSAPLRPYLLTELLQFIAQTSPEKMKEMTLSETYLNKISRNGKKKGVYLTIMPWGICQVEHGAVVRTYLFHLINSILTVSDKHGAFVIEYGKTCKQKYLFEYKRSELMILLTTIRSAADSYISETILDGKIPLKQAEEDAVCCKEVLNPFNTLEEFRMFKVNKVRHGDPSLRVVSLTKNFIVERLTHTDRVVSLHRIAHVDRVLINTNTPGGFTIFYKNDARGVYTCDSAAVRDSFVAYLLDSAAAAGVRHISVAAVGPNRCFCVLPPGVPVDVCTEEQLLTTIATWDASNRLDEFMSMLSKFNANIPYSGPKHITEAPKLEKLAVKALETILRLSTPVCTNAQTFAAIYRLLIIPIVFNTFIDTKPLQGKLLALIKPILSTQNYDSVLIYNMINVVHLLVAPQLHMEFEKLEEFSTNNGYDEIGVIEKAIEDVNRKEVPFETPGQLTLSSSGNDGLGGSGGGSVYGSAFYDDMDDMDESPAAQKSSKDLVTLSNVLTDSASSELLEHMSEIKYFREEGKTILMEDDVIIQLFLTHLMSCIFRDSASLMVLGWINVFSALIFSDSKKSDTENALNNSLLDRMGMLGRGFFKLFSQSYCPSITRNSLAILNLMLRRGDSKLSASIKHMALSDGATLQYFRAFLYPEVATVKTIITSVVKRQLFRILVTGCDPALGMVKRIVPPGLAYFLTGDDNNNNGSSSNNSETLVRLRSSNDMDRKLIFGMKFLGRWNRNIPVNLSGNKKLLAGELDWKRFYEEFQCDHVKPDLVWNRGTRQELKGALDGEISTFQREQSVLHNKCITWNHAEFTVKYRSLEREVRVGGYYLQLLLDDKKVNTVRDPVELYDLLFRRVLVERNTELQALCVQALTTVYMCFQDRIGPFKDVEHMVTLLYYCNDYLVRDRLIQLFQVVTAASMANAYAFTKSKGIPLLVDLLTLSHLGTGKKGTSAAPDEAEKDVPKEWYYSNRGNAYPHASYTPGDESGGPLTLDELRRLYRTGVVTLHTLVWAQGMADWEALEDVLPARWALMGTGQRILNDEELCESIIDIFTTLCEAFPTKDEAGILIRPVSKPKQQLASAKVLPHLVQLLLVRKGPITSRVVTLLSILLYENPQAIAQLYRTGFFYFAISQNPRNLEYLFDLFKLVKLLHRRQAAAPARVVFASDTSSSSSSSSSNSSKNGSIYDDILPEGLVCYLDLLSPEMYISVIMGVEQSISPIKIVWDDDMRKTLTRSIKKHLGNFPRRLTENPKAVYQYKPMPPVEYARSKSPDAPGYRVDDIFCYHYYVNRIKIPEKFFLYSTENPLDFVSELDALLPNVQNYPNETELRNIIVRLQAHLYRKYYKVLSTPKYAHYETLAEILGTSEPSDPVVAAAVSLASITVQCSDANLIAMESSGCLAAVMDVFVAVGTPEIKKLSACEESILRRTLRILSFVADKPKYAGFIDKHASGIAKAMFRVLHAYNFEKSSEVSDELVKSVLSCMPKLVPRKSFASEFVASRLFYELVPVLFKYSMHTPNFVSVGKVEDPEKDIAQLSYDSLKMVARYTAGDGEEQLTIEYHAGGSTSSEDICNTFKTQVLSLFTSNILENLKLDSSKEFFSELLSMDKNSIVEKIKAFESQYK